jgi:hypothetical protein
MIFKKTDFFRPDPLSEYSLICMKFLSYKK